MGGMWNEQLPVIAMVLSQFVYSTMTLLNRAALVEGMSPRVFIFYRQAIATLVMSPFAYFTRAKSSTSMGTRSFLLIFVMALIGGAVNQSLYFEGLYLASSSIASAMGNLVPAITFVIAAIMGMEQVNMKRMSSIAKVSGTVFCVSGAVSIALVRGTKLLNNEQLPSSNSLVLNSLRGTEPWLLGCMFLFASAFSWSLWLILQVPVTTCYPNHLALAAWMCFMSMLQSGAVALFLEKDPTAWIVSSPLELASCIFSGVVGSGIQSVVQSWCIQRRGPLFSAMFNPLGTIITTVFACIVLHEEIYLGSLLGAIAVIVGLYVVLWGKAQEMKKGLCSEQDNPNSVPKHKSSSNIDLEQPLMIDNSVDRD